MSPSVCSENCWNVGQQLILMDLLIQSDNEVFFHLIKYEQALFHYRWKGTEASETTDLVNKEMNPQEIHRREELVAKTRSCNFANGFDRKPAYQQEGDRIEMWNVFLNDTL